LRTMTPPADCDVEIVIVDNNSTDNTPRGRRRSGPPVALPDRRRPRIGAGQELRAQPRSASGARRRGGADRR
jgi:hypothetical protein